VFEHLQRLSLRFHYHQPTGDLVRRVTRDSRCARDLALDVVAPGLTSLITLLAMLAVMWRLDPSLSLTALLVVPLICVANRRYYRPMVEKTHEQQECEGALMSHAERVLTSLPIVQAFRREAHEDAGFRQIAARTLQACFRALAAQLKFSLSVGGATAMGQTAVMVAGGYRVLQGNLTVGDLLVFIAYVGMLYTPLETLANLTATAAACEASARRVFEVLDSAELTDDHSGQPGLVPAGGWRGHVQFEGVSFGYEPDRLVLRRVNLEVLPGQRVAVIGRTGAGKSTLMSLLLRFFDPSAGCIRLDGIDLREMSRPTLREQIGILLQEPFLLPVTVAENIAYGRPRATREEIVAAATAANADGFISHLPQGYDTVIGERGATLSGGEKQRIAIARALLKNAPVLILDEPTAALDAQTEKHVVEAVHRLTQDRTTFVIAHRSSTIRDVSRIVLLHEGQLTELPPRAATTALSAAMCGERNETWQAPQDAPLAKRIH
jgi:ATP-binding cassette subfamily B protein/subfamily B ATP-binding cassette protein MsbA